MVNQPPATNVANLMRAIATGMRAGASQQELEKVISIASKGLPPRKLEAPLNLCPGCKGLEVVKDADRGGEMAPCPICGTSARAEWFARNCGLEGKMLDLRVKDWGVGKWLDGARIKQREEAGTAIEYFISHPTGFVTFHGDFGSGKSTAMSIICNELREQMIETLYAPLSKILDYLRNQIGAREDSGPYWNRMLNVPVLALDEVTRYNATDWAQDKLFLLVDTRYRRKDTHLTLFATNDDPRKELPPAEAIGYLFSRLREGDLLELRGDMRPAVVQKKWM